MGKKEGMDTEAVEKKQCHAVWVEDKKDQKSLVGQFPFFFIDAFLI